MKILENNLDNNFILVMNLLFNL